jgi:hypothetical protein
MYPFVLSRPFHSRVFSTNSYLHENRTVQPQNHDVGRWDAITQHFAMSAQSESECSPNRSTPILLHFAVCSSFIKPKPYLSHNLVPPTLLSHPNVTDPFLTRGQWGLGAIRFTVFCISCLSTLFTPPRLSPHLARRRLGGTHILKLVTCSIQYPSIAALRSSEPNLVRSLCAIFRTAVWTQYGHHVVNQDSHCSQREMHSVVSSESNGCSICNSLGPTTATAGLVEPSHVKKSLNSPTAGHRLHRVLAPG